MRGAPPFVPPPSHLPKFRITACSPKLQVLYSWLLNLLYEFCPTLHIAAACVLRLRQTEQALQA